MAATKRKPLGVHYKIQVENPHAHLWRVIVLVEQPLAKQHFQLPVWIPGSYLVREFSKQLSAVHAAQREKSLPVKQLDKSTWEVICKPSQTLEFQYLVHAHDHSVRTAWLDVNRGFFNGTSMCVQVVGKSSQAVKLDIIQPAHTDTWQVATALKPVRVNREGFGTYRAESYDELADSPVEMSDFVQTEFTHRQSKHRVVVTGAPLSFDKQRLHQDVEKICQTITDFWQQGKAPPFKNYAFLLNAVSDGYGGLEHRNSTALLCRRKDLPKLSDNNRTDDYIGLLGLFSHEYFHSWNVKRLRPSNYEHYAYQSEQYTDMLWFFEGFTDYFDNLMLCRAELISPAQYLKLLNKSIQLYFQTPGRLTHTVAQSSFEAWTKYYRPDSNTPNITVSYYTKGSLIALCFDLALRQSGQSLDKVMRALWHDCQGGPMTESDILQALANISGKPWRKQLKAWVHSVDELPLQELLQKQGVKVDHEPSPLAQQLGLRVKEDHSVHIQTVFRDSAAEKAGFAAGDEWLGIEIGRGKALQAWRLQRLDQLGLVLGQHMQCTAMVARDGQIQRLNLSLPDKDPTPLWRLGIADPIKVGNWLSDKP